MKIRYNDDGAPSVWSRLLLALLLLATGFIPGCTRTQQEKANDIHERPLAHMNVQWSVDQETGCEYWAGTYESPTPRLDAWGRPKGCRMLEQPQ